MEQTINIGYEQEYYQRPYQEFFNKNRGKLRDGNNKLSRSSRVYKKKYRNWFFTFNNYSEEDIQMLIRELKHYVFQEEKGEKTGTPHLQGVFMLDNPRSYDGLRKSLGDKIYLQKLRSKKHAVNYCTKTKTRIGKIYSGGKLRRLKDPLDGCKLYEWEEMCLKIIKKEPDKRAIYWIWSEEGNKGKSSFCKHLAMNYGACVLGSVKNNSAYALKCHLEKHDIMEVVCFDLSRDKQNNISYDLLEKVKNGLIFCGKYESGTIMFDPPHVFVFANVPPEFGRLSGDRLKVFEIN